MSFILSQRLQCLEYKITSRIRMVNCLFILVKIITTPDTSFNLSRFLVTDPSFQLQIWVPVRSEILDPPPFPQSSSL